MLVGVVADTHLPRGARRLPEACLERLRRADLVLHAGDFVSAAFLAELESLGPPVAGVYGNMDEPEVKETLPRERVVEANGAWIGLIHIPGPRYGREERLIARFPRCDAVVYGHTHVPQVDRVGQVWILNPGSPTERRTAPGHSMLMLRIDRGKIVPELIPI
jgi:uncharacterized protein